MWAMNFVYFDLETERSAQEVGGWGNIEQLGIAVAVTCASGDDQDGQAQFKTFLGDQTDDLLAELRRADCVVGFNTRGFDFRVLQPFVAFDLKSLHNIDLMLDLKAVAGFRPGLDNCCAQTLGSQKSGGGLQSLQWWREGRRDEVIAYCRQDVLLTRQLHEFGARQGFVKCLDKNAKERVLRVAWSLDDSAPAPQQGTLF